ncbi:response regulator transcription factor [Methylobacterium sp. NEAU 140]|uniref:response regulator transcription factor n=1 Tax=Methylobacterium sp. NEAU 140 TaxID=3064945 RepID=UPI0027361552|nr:response regulator transcription factor [Methylobacterium sp. NEAU 140]MDP4023737.1 response regulator transcription factor [Methylobacterium sp. NEAU 140]
MMNGLQASGRILPDSKYILDARSRSDDASNDVTRQEAPVSADNDAGTTILIDRRPLIGQCVIASLQSADRTSKFLVYPSVEHVLSATVVPETSTIVLSYADCHLHNSELEQIKRDIHTLRTRIGSVSIIVMADSENATYILKVFQLGVRGYIPTTSSLNVVVQALRLISAGGTYMPANCMLNALVKPAVQVTEEPAQDEFFSPRQLSVARALRKGTPNKIIAYELNMCESTVKVHVRNIMKKLKAKNRTEVAYLTNKYFSSD